jgi:hypothetical protein
LLSKRKLVLKTDISAPSQSKESKYESEGEELDMLGDTAEWGFLTALKLTDFSVDIIQCLLKKNLTTPIARI